MCPEIFLLFDYYSKSVFFSGKCWTFMLISYIWICLNVCVCMYLWFIIWLLNFVLLLTIFWRLKIYTIFINIFISLPELLFLNILLFLLFVQNYKFFFFDVVRKIIKKNKLCITNKEKWYTFVYTAWRLKMPILYYCSFCGGGALYDGAWNFRFNFFFI